MANISSVQKVGNLLIITYDDGTITRSTIAYEDVVLSKAPSGSTPVDILYLTGGKLIVQYNGSTIELDPAGGASAFTDLTDVDNSYTGDGGKYVRVKAAEDGLEFATPAGGGTVDTSGTPEDNDFAKFTDADTIEGRSYAEVRGDLDLEAGTDFPSLTTFNDHSARHENAGDDEISVAGLSGLLADDQHVLDTEVLVVAEAAGATATHAALTTGVHGVGAGTVAKTADITATKIDDLTAGDDNTDLDANTTRHGLLLKATAPAANLLNVVGIANGETVYTDKAIFDATNPAALGAVAPGTAVVAAHRDHVHANPAIDTLAAATDITTLDATTSAHGLVVKATAPAASLYNYIGITNGETAYTNKALFDATVPSTQAIGDAAATGTATVSARRDHKHAMPSQATMDAASVAAVNAAGITPAENFGFVLDSALSGDGKWTGIVVAGVLGATVAFGEVVYFKSTDSQWYLAKADATATSGAVKVGICVVGGNDNDPTTILLFGKVYATAYSLTVASPVFISAATAGVLTSTAPTGTTNFVVRIVGYCVATDELFFQPDNTYLELA